MWFVGNNEKQMLRLKAMNMGMFRTRGGIFDYYMTFEGKSAKEAGELTDIECKYRGISDTDPAEAKKPSMVDDLKKEVVGYVVNTVKEDPATALKTAGDIAGSLFATLIGAFAGKAVAENSTSPGTTTDPKPAPKDDTPAIDINELMQEDQTKTE